MRFMSFPFHFILISNEFAGLAGIESIEWDEKLEKWLCAYCYTSGSSSS